MEHKETVNQIVKEIEQRYQVDVSLGGALLLSGVTVRTNSLREFVRDTKVICSDEAERKVIYATAKNILLQKYTKEKRVRAKSWDFFECFNINRYGVPCHNGVPFKPFLKYIKAIAKAHGANLDDMEILKIKMEIDQRLESDI